MTALEWDDPADRRYELGVDRGVLYVDDIPGVAWNGLVSVDEAASGGDPRPYYLDGEKYLNRPMREEFEATITAYMSPREFDDCDGTVAFMPGIFVSQQHRKSFGLSYRTKIGNSTEAEDFAYKIHVIYGAKAAPSNRSYATISEEVEPLLLSWGITTKAIPFPGLLASSHLIIDTSEVDPEALEILEGILYGDEDHDPRLPTPLEIADIFMNPFNFTVTDNEDGTFTVSGPSESIEMLDSGLYKITRDTVIYIDAETAEISGDDD